jgi:Helicase conserved C-terminal domain/DEAD/DEAH box helicase
MNSKIRQYAYEVLSEIERHELRLLSWGFYDLYIEESELDSILDPDRLDTPLWKDFFEADCLKKVLSLLRKERLILNPRFNPDNALRSRFAETLRLLARLKQRFSEKDWLTGSNLVLDMRTILQSKAIPVRNLPYKEVVKHLAKGKVPLSKIQKEVLRLLLQGIEGESLELSRFQLDSVASILDPKYLGVVIGAGTGTGKTKAFYLPALLEVIPLLNKKKPFTKVIVVYPRKELLKDQLRECLAECRKLQPLLAPDQESVRLGAFYADTPTTYSSVQQKWSSPESGSFLCPMTRCPNCKGELSWFEHHIRKNLDQLRCADCGEMIMPWELTLTREGLFQSPPDILFTTTEMLNRLLSCTEAHPLLGIKRKNEDQVRFLLLDEIHTYEGIHGAHIAYLMRRWRGLTSGSPCTTVGLSATLQDAKRFMAELSGIEEYRINYITPKEEDLRYEGMHYNLALKGDPASATALLSTSIQTGMLLRRIQNPRAPGLQTPTAGSRAFAFADRLDTISRWHSNFSDAETKKRLARYRKSTGDPYRDRQRDELGQNWWICEEIGHNLDQSLRIDSVSSLSPDLQSSADIIIATASLEVGYDDPTVGVVIQHKSPHNDASFIQRKGRAGRTRFMRPWSVVILSDYGRDRWTFDHAEHLFSPVLPAKHLPLGNRYILQIQAGFAFLDWLASNHFNIYAFNDLDGRKTNETTKRVADLIFRILSDTSGDLGMSYQRHLESTIFSGKSNEEILNLVLWGKPRSIYLSFFPALWRRLTSGWKDCSPGGTKDFQANYCCMPDYLPRSLFSDLSLPEVEIHLPNLSKTQNLPIEQALSEFVPGNVTKRYSPLTDRNMADAHWISIQDSIENNLSFLTTDTAFPSMLECLGTVEVAGELLPYFRPTVIQMEKIPNEVKEYSSASLEWHSIFSVSNNHEAFSAFKKHQSLFLDSVHLFASRNDSPLVVSRVAVASNYDIHMNKKEYRGRIEFKRSSPKVDRHGIGFDLSVDAIRFDCKPPDSSTLSALFSPRGTQLERSFRPLYVKHLMKTDQVLNEYTNRFQLEWLWQCEISALCHVSLTRDVTLEKAEKILESEGRSSHYDAVLSKILRSVEDEGESNPRLGQRLLELSNSSVVTSHLASATRRGLFSDLDDSFMSWSLERLRNTWRSALLLTVQNLVREVEESELVADIDGDTIWVSETSIGGVGLVEKIYDQLIANPSQFLKLLRNNFTDCRKSFFSGQLKTFLEEKLKPGALCQVCQRLTSGEQSLSRMDEIKKELQQEMLSVGIFPEREILVSLNSQLLRTGMTVDHDLLIQDLHKSWREAEEKLGIEIDKRVFAYVVVSQLGDRAQQLWNVSLSDSQKFNLFQNLLWSDCLDSCAFCLDRSHKFKEMEPPSRQLALQLYGISNQMIPWGNEHFDKLVEQSLLTTGRVDISISPAELTAVQNWLVERLATPLEFDYQFLYPIIEGTEIRNQRWLLALAIRELKYV